MGETPRCDAQELYMPKANPWLCFEKAMKLARELEKEVQELVGIFELQRKREKPWIERWRQETGKELSVPDYGALLQWIMERAERSEKESEVFKQELTRVRPLADSYTRVCAARGIEKDLLGHIHQLEQRYEHTINELKGRLADAEKEIENIEVERKEEIGF